MPLVAREATTRHPDCKSDLQDFVDLSVQAMRKIQRV